MPIRCDVPSGVTCRSSVTLEMTLTFALTLPVALDVALEVALEVAFCSGPAASQCLKGGLGRA